MKILITGALGFVGQNLVAALDNIQKGKDRTHPELVIDTLYRYDVNTPDEVLCEGVKNADFVFHLAGVNRPEKQEDFITGNVDFSQKLLTMLKEAGNTCPVMLSSSIQATLAGRYAGSPYAESKKKGEDLFFAYAAETGAKVLVYRFPNLFGKWCRPNYNSAVATFCHNIANDLPITVSDPKIELELLYIDDLIDEMLDALSGREHRCEFDGVHTVLCEGGRFCAAPVTHRVTLGEIVSHLEAFHDQPKTLMIPEMPKGSFAKKLYATYLSYLPADKAAFALDMKCDERGSFTELLRSAACGQVSVNITKPGVTKGKHWHNTKWEFFIVVAGKGRIRMRKLGSDEVLSYEVSGDKIQAVQMLPGYAHELTNLSDTDDLVTVMWANELFETSHPDTFFEEI